MEMKAAILIMDYNLYPRHKINEYNVNRIINSIEAGEKLPPVLIDKESKRIIDGFHRTRAHLKAFGDEATIDVIEKEYGSEQEMFLDATRLNATHGQVLSQWDKVRCIERASDLGIKPDDMATALAVSKTRYTEYKKTHYGTVKRATGTKGKRIEQIALKGSLSHLAGRRLSKRQVECNEKASGWPLLYHINQVLNFINNDGVNTEKESEMLGLVNLKDRLNEFI